MSKHLPKDSNAVMQQVGWLGQSGRYYPLDISLTEIHKVETASYRPVYEQVGTWEWNEAVKHDMSRLIICKYCHFPVDKRVMLQHALATCISDDIQKITQPNELYE